MKKKEIKCRNCGSYIQEEDAKFCPNCGHPVSGSAQYEGKGKMRMPAVLGIVFGVLLLVGVGVYWNWDFIQLKMIHNGETFTVSFHCNVNSDKIDHAPEMQIVSYGETAYCPSAPTCEGYVFDTWYIDEACSEVYDFGTAVKEDMVLYAGWLEADTDTNEDTDVAGDTDTNADAEDAQAEEVSLNSEPVQLEGYVYDRNGNPLPDVSVKAELTENPKAYTEAVTTDENGYYCLEVPEENTYTLSYSLDGYNMMENEFRVTAGMYDNAQKGIATNVEDVLMDAGYDKYIGSYRIFEGQTYITLTLTDLDSSGGTFFLDTENVRRIIFRGPFHAQFDEDGTLSGAGYNSFGGANEIFSLTFDGDVIVANGSDANWTFDINADRIDMIDITLNH